MITAYKIGEGYMYTWDIYKSKSYGVSKQTHKIHSSF